MKKSLISIIIFTILFLVSCAVSEEESIAKEIESTTDELNQIAVQIDTALEVDNIGDVRELVPEYAAKAEKFEQLADRYAELVGDSDDPEVKEYVKELKQDRIIIHENVEEWITQLQTYDDIMAVLNTILLITEIVEE